MSHCMGSTPAAMHLSDLTWIATASIKWCLALYSIVLCTTNGRVQPGRAGPDFLSQKRAQAGPGQAPPGKSVERAEPGHQKVARADL
jgi:hypothetical protein